MPMESDDEYENDSDDEWEPNRDDYLHNSQDHEKTVSASNVDDTTADDISEEPEDLDDQTKSATTSRKNTNTRGNQKRNIIWKRGNLTFPNTEKSFLGNENLPSEIIKLETPYQFFQY
ncbi:hypothetical protein Zmor_006128 [Zophobas morio]|uniref:Uncharacterized protein n=1 Tax=Zophobas morio TaxID=2755281 RepID=A0AA38IUF0_9CUCU|nr:hypothetical protein Zmor_006128 [Zophobas morio]